MIPYFGVLLRVFSARNSAFSAPRIWMVDAGHFASDTSDPECAISRAPTTSPISADRFGATECMRSCRYAKRSSRYSASSTTLRVQFHKKRSQLGGEEIDALQVRRGELLPHRRAARVADLARQRLVEHDREQLGDAVVVVEEGAGLHGAHHARVERVVLDQLLELGEMPAVPLLHAHGERVQVLIDLNVSLKREKTNLVEQADRLDDHVVLAIHVELHVRARVRMAKTQHRFLRGAVRQGRHELAVVLADATAHLRDHIVRHAGDLQLFLDGLADLRVDLKQ